MRSALPGLPVDLAEILGVHVKTRQCVLNGVDSLTVENGLSALPAHPSRNGVPVNVIPSTVGVKRRRSLSQTAATVYTGHHRRLLVLISVLHIAGSGRYAVITAAYSAFGAATT